MIIKTSYPFMKPPPSARLIRGHRLAQGLVCGLPFNENGGLQVFDLSGNGNNGTFGIADRVQGFPFWTSGKFGSAIGFSGDEDHLSIPDTPLLRFNSATQDFTVCILVRADGGQANQTLIDKRDANDNGWVLRTIGGVVWLSINGVDVKGAININDNKWHYVCAVANRSGNGQIYIDGVADGNPIDISGQAMDTTTAMAIGTTSYAVTVNELTGKVDHIMIYNRIFDTSEIAELYWRPFCMFERRARVALMGGFVTAEPPVGNAGIMTTNTGFWGPTF